MMKLKKIAFAFALSAMIAAGAFTGAYCETAQPTAEVTEATETVSETTEDSATAQPEATEATTTVESPDFSGNSDPNSTLRVILAAIGAFAIAFMYSYTQRAKNRSKKKK